MALLMAPFLMDTPEAENLFPPDAIARAKLYLKNLKGGLGAYSDSKGNPFIRQEIADFIERETGQRNSNQCKIYLKFFLGVPSNIDNIFISNGASECARMLLYAMIRGKSDGVLVPIPQYPLYSASVSPTSFLAHQCNY